MTPIQIDNSVVGVVIVFIVVLVPLVSAFMTYRATNATTTRITASNATLTEAHDQIRELAHSMNSIRDALVLATKDAATLAGHAQGVLDERARAALVQATEVRVMDRLRKEGVPSKLVSTPEPPGRTK
jgi:hypothetical protein